MYQGKKILAVIPARGNSKGIPRKNMKKIAGRPLFLWTVDAAKNCSCSSIGVSYGYGTREELRAAGADLVAETVGELRQCLMKNT